MRIKKIYVGKEKEFKKKSGLFNSSYIKEEVKDKISVNFFGLENDTQADKKSHGGKDRAVCIYSQSSYDSLASKYNILLEECMFGENITLLDSCEEEICIGDIYSCADAVFEVSQPRLPCWKISYITGIRNLTSLVVKEAKTGFFLRVLKEGHISSEDNFSLVKRVNPNISIAHINRCYYDAKNNQEEIERILKIPELAKDYQISLKKRYKDKKQGIELFQRDKI